MSRDGSGNFTKAIADFINGTVANATDVNTLIDDIGDEITNSVDKDGQTVYTGTHDWNGNFAITDVDGDSKIGSSADDQFDVTLSGTLNHKLTVSGYEFAAISNPTFLARDTDGVYTISANSAVLGAIIKLYGDTHATKAGDLDFLSDTTSILSYDLSATAWNFGTNTVKIDTIAESTAANGVSIDSVVLKDGGITLTGNLVIGSADISEAELEILDGATVSTAELNYLDITTLGTSEASKAVTADGSGNVNFADGQLSRVNILDYGSVTNAIGGTGGGTQDIDLTLGNSVSATVDTSANTFTFSNPTASDEECGFVLYLTNGGSQTVNWPASVDWPAGTAPTLTTSGLDILVFTTIDGGTTWYGNVVGQAYA